MTLESLKENELRFESIETIDMGEQKLMSVDTESSRPSCSGCSRLSSEPWTVNLPIVDLPLGRQPENSKNSLH